MPFAEFARIIFEPMLSKFGMQSVEERDSFVRYQNNRSFLSISFDKSKSHELDVQIGEVNAPGGRAFSFTEILAMKKHLPVSDLDVLSANDDKQLIAALKSLAELVAEFAREFLNGHSQAFDELAKFRYEESVRYAQWSR